MILVMTVNPGFGGQSYIATMEPKIREVRDMITRRGLGDSVHLEVDGGISPTTIAGAAKAGANVLIAGSALYKDPKGLAHAVTQLRALATEAFTA
jgi:ribulose-phosphate 3-epimerase